ncbi:hypothetical protein G6F57_020890 [Rhizopus arrhizus]|nr:hypothetical protein G6F57_020890 [Rhizopus arrhizus]
MNRATRSLWWVRTVDRQAHVSAAARACPACAPAAGTHRGRRCAAPAVRRGAPSRLRSRRTAAAPPGPARAGRSAPAPGSRNALRHARPAAAHPRAPRARVSGAGQPR